MKICYVDIENELTIIYKNLLKKYFFDTIFVSNLKIKAKIL